MSISTFTFSQYSLSGATYVVEVVSGFLLREMIEGPRVSPAIFDEVIGDLKRYLEFDHGFVRIELPELKADDLVYFSDVIARCIDRIKSFGGEIPLEELKKMQDAGFLLREAEYLGDFPTTYVLSYLNQLDKMMRLTADSDLLKTNTSEDFQILKD